MMVRPNVTSHRRLHGQASSLSSVASTSEVGSHIRLPDWLSEASCTYLLVCLIASFGQSASATLASSLVATFTLHYSTSFHTRTTIGPQLSLVMVLQQWQLCTSVTFGHRCACLVQVTMVRKHSTMSRKTTTYVYVQAFGISH